MMRRLDILMFVFLALSVSIALSACGDNIVKTTSGLRYEELVEGTGVEATDRMPVEVHYTVWAADDATGLKKVEKIQSSRDMGEPYQCTIGINLVRGWSEGMVGMKEGGTRRLYVPWELGYGESGMGSMIQPKQNLIFEIEFLRKL